MLIDPLSFFIGAIVGIGLWILGGRVRPLIAQMRANFKEQREAAQVRRTSGLEDNHRRLTLRRAQGAHLAAALFSLDEILQEPRLLAPPARVEPANPRPPAPKCAALAAAAAAALVVTCGTTIPLEPQSSACSTRPGVTSGTRTTLGISPLRKA